MKRAGALKKTGVLNGAGRWLLLPRAILWTLVTLLALSLLVAGLALSPWGTQKLLEQAQSRGMLTYERVAGAPLDDFLIEGLRFETPSLRLRVDRLAFEWGSDCLLGGRLCLDRLAVEGIDVVLRDGARAPAEESADSGGGRLATPIPIELRDLNLSDIALYLADGTRVSLGHLASAATFDGSRLTLAPTRLVGTRIVLPSPPGLDRPDLLDAEVDVRTARRIARPDIVASSAILAAQSVAQTASVALRDGEYDFALSDPAIESAEAVASPAPGGFLAQMAALAEGQQANPLAAIVGATDAQGRVVMPTVRLPLDIEVQSFVASDLRLVGERPVLVNELAVEAQATGSRVALERFELDSSLAELSMTASATLDGDYPLAFVLEALLHDTPLAGETMTLEIDGSLADLELALHAEGPVAARLQARADALAPDLPFGFSLTSPALHWPLAAQSDETVWQAQALTLAAEGSLRDYRIDLASDLQGPDVAPLSIALNGSGDLGHFEWAPLAVEAGQGRLVSRGRAGWRDGLDVEAALELEALALDRFTDAVSGRLDGSTRARFALQGEHWTLDVPELAIDGELQRRPLSLEGRLSGNSDMQWQFDDLDLRQGDNRLTASGRVGQPAEDRDEGNRKASDRNGGLGDRTLALTADLNAPALETILPALGGSASGRIRLGGTVEQPDSDIELRGDGLRFQNNRLGALRLEATTAGLEDPRFDLSLDIQGVEAADRQIERVRAELDGRLGRHRLTLGVEGGSGLPVERLDLALEGRLDRARQRYAGALSTLEISSPQAGDIALDGSLGFVALLAQPRVNAEPFCLVRQQGGRVCSVAELSASTERGRAELRLSEIDLSSANDYLPSPWQLNGDLTGDVAADWSQGGESWTLDADFQSLADIQGENALGQPFSLPRAELALSLNATPARAEADLALALQDAGRLRLAADIGDPIGERSLSGRLQLEGLELAPYTPLVVSLTELEGQLNGDVALSGSADAPRLDGSMVLGGVSASGAQLPVALDDARIAMAFDGERGDLDGYLQVGGARWTLDGDASWPTTGDWRAGMALDGAGSPLELRLPDFGRLRIAPDLQVAARPERLTVRGDIRIPWARLEVGQIPPSAVKPSSDEVIVSREAYEARQQAAIERAARTGLEEQFDWATTEELDEAGMEVDVAVSLMIGGDVELEAYGLNAHVEGHLNVRQSSGALQLFGDVSLVDGRFQALGQDLIVRRGQVLFSGPPGQPYLDIDAIRNPDSTQDDVIAGLQVSGPVDRPALDVFSEPAMNETRALSYLLRGRAPNTQGGESDDMLTSALIGLSLSRSGKAIGQLGQSFGVEELSLGTAGSGDDSQVVVSGYLFEDFEVSYGVGLFSSIAELTLRYRLLQNLYLQAVSGANQAVDLIYTFSLGRTAVPDERE